MKEVSIPTTGGMRFEQGRILSGIFVDDVEKVKRYDIFSQLLADGYEVLHLGNNAKPIFFIHQMQKFSPQVIVFICQGNIESIRRLIDIIKDEGLRSMARIILYGPDIEETVRDEVHADAYASNEEDLYDMIHEIMVETYAS